jgi:hypothetical protein
VVRQWADVESGELQLEKNKLTSEDCFVPVVYIRHRDNTILTSIAGGSGCNAVRILPAIACDFVY